MAKPATSVTPTDRVERWRKKWGAPRRLTQAETDAVFDEFADALVPGHMHKLFLKTFGQPKAKFGNRFFSDEAAFFDWATRLAHWVPDRVTHAEATVIYGSPDALEAWTFRGETRRTLQDVVVDDWHAACAILRAEEWTLYLFIEPKMRGCIVKSVRTGEEDE